MKKLILMAVLTAALAAPAMAQTAPVAPAGGTTVASPAPGSATGKKPKPNQKGHHHHHGHHHGNHHGHHHKNTKSGLNKKSLHPKKGAAKKPTAIASTAPSAPTGTNQ